MSLTRQLLHDIRPLFRVLEEPFGRSANYYGLPTRSFLDEPFFQPSNALRPSIDVTEEGNSFVVEADLPGVKKENVEVRIGDGGRSLTIEGKIFRRRNGSEDKPEVTPVAEATGTETPAEEGADATKTEQSRTPSTERQGSTMMSTSTFSRTVWLPRVVDGSNVTAKLIDGVLTLTMPKVDDKVSTKIVVE